MTGRDSPARCEPAPAPGPGAVGHAVRVGPLDHAPSRSLRRDARSILEVNARESKIPAGRPHGRKTGSQRTAMAALDALNLPLTRYANVLGDRAVMVCRKP